MSRIEPAARAMRRAVEAARNAGLERLGESELFPVLDALGWDTPLTRVLVGDGADLDLAAFPGERVVLKRLDVSHRTEVGGVQVVARTPAAVRRALARSPGGRAGRWAVQAWIEHDRDPGGELLIGARWSPEFGAVVSLGPGGVAAERMADLTGAAGGVLHLSPTLHGTGGRDAALERALAAWPLAPLVSGTPRRREARVPLALLRKAVAGFLELAEAVMPGLLVELEVNPLVLEDGAPVALDALARLSPEPVPGRTAPPMPSWRRAGMEAVLHPRSVGLIGVSRGDNPGRAILRNLMDLGYSPEAVRIVKPGLDRLEGCACVPDVDALDPPVDLLVVSVPARDVPPLMERVVAGHRARAVVLVSGGLGEGGGNRAGADAVGRLLREAGPGAPVVNGPNCLGVRSWPARCDTLFIPRERLSFPRVDPQPVAVISQSGAFAIARASALRWLNPRYLVTVGNQLDLTVGEYLEHLADDPAVRVFACYVEGFRPLDGLRFLRTARRLAREGRPVVLYRAGRTAQGARAAVSHTASLAGDWGLTRALAREAGVLVADRLDDFEDLLRVATALDGFSVGPRLGALSNAGFECVALADAAADLSLAQLSESTRRALDGLVAGRGLEGVVAARNPMDVTPIFDDEAFVRATGLVLADEGVDVGLIGCVPLTPALHPPMAAGDEESGSGLLEGLRGLRASARKGWVAVVDGGPAYDPFAHRLEDSGIPAFRRGDRAASTLARYVRWRMAVGDD